VILAIELQVKLQLRFFLVANRVATDFLVASEVTTRNDTSAPLN
jgi:hypothetical protein